MLKASEVIALCALERKESRGSQWRLDYPDKDDAHWGKVNLIARKRGEQVEISERPLEPMRADLQALFDA